MKYSGYNPSILFRAWSILHSKESLWLHIKVLKILHHNNWNCNKTANCVKASKLSVLSNINWLCCLLKLAQRLASTDKQDINERFVPLKTLILLRLRWYKISQPESGLLDLQTQTVRAKFIRFGSRGILAMQATSTTPMVLCVEVLASSWSTTT